MKNHQPTISSRNAYAPSTTSFQNPSSPPLEPGRLTLQFQTENRIHVLFLWFIPRSRLLFGGCSCPFIYMELFKLPNYTHVITLVTPCTIEWEEFEHNETRNNSLIVMVMQVLNCSDELNYCTVSGLFPCVFFSTEYSFNESGYVFLLCYQSYSHFWRKINDFLFAGEGHGYIDVFYWGGTGSHKNLSAILESTC